MENVMHGFVGFYGCYPPSFSVSLLSLSSPYFRFLPSSPKSTLRISLPFVCLGRAHQRRQAPPNDLAVSQVVVRPMVPGSIKPEMLSFVRTGIAG